MKDYTFRQIPDETAPLHNAQLRLELRPPVHIESTICVKRVAEITKVSCHTTYTHLWKRKLSEHGEGVKVKGVKVAILFLDSPSGAERFTNPRPFIALAPDIRC